MCSHINRPISSAYSIVIRRPVVIEVDTRLSVPVNPHEALSPREVFVQKVGSAARTSERWDLNPTPESSGCMRAVDLAANNGQPRSGFGTSSICKCRGDSIATDSEVRIKTSEVGNSPVK